MKGKYDKRNKLNNLSGTEWLKLTGSFWFSEKCVADKDAFNHPAPFLIKDVMKLINMFTKKEMIVLDPFAGSGTTLIAAGNIGRKSIGIDLNQEYKKLAKFRLNKLMYVESKDYEYIVGDSNKVIPTIENYDYIVTSPPYHNILQNNGGGLRAKKNNGYRNGARIGVEYYSNMENDLGNKKDYAEFLNSLKEIMGKAYQKLSDKKYCSIIISDFTVNKKEVCVQKDIVRLMEDIGFKFVGTIALLQNNKPLYPFGYPYAYKINHHHQNIINFQKNVS